MATNLLFLLLSFGFFQSPPVLKIEINGLESNKGSVLLEVTDAEKNVLKGLSESIKNNSCTFVINDLEPGKYSFKYFHDENSNEKLDTKLIGMPKEGFGFSNNAKGKFGPPKHAKTLFELKGDTTLICNPIYL
jgi:uncharacterized protein (DUF2141 family)